MGRLGRSLKRKKPPPQDSQAEVLESALLKASQNWKSDPGRLSQIGLLEDESQLESQVNKVP